MFNFENFYSRLISFCQTGWFPPLWHKIQKSNKNAKTFPLLDIGLNLTVHTEASRSIDVLLTNVKYESFNIFERKKYKE